MKKISRFSRSVSMVIALVMGMSAVLPGLSFDSWAKDADENVIMDYIRSVEIEVKQGNEVLEAPYESLDPKENYNISAEYKSGDISEGLLDGTLKASTSYKVPLPNVFGMTNNGQTLDINLEPEDTLYDYVKNKTIGTVKFHIKQPDKTGDDVGIDSYAEIRFNQSFVTEIKKLNNGVPDLKPEDDTATSSNSNKASASSASHPSQIASASNGRNDSDVLFPFADRDVDVSGIYFYFGLSGSCSWRDICVDTSYDKVIPFEGNNEVELNFKVPVIESEDQFSITKSAKYESSDGAVLWDIVAATNNGSRFPEGTVITDSYSDNSSLLEDTLVITSDGGQYEMVEGEDYQLERATGSIIITLLKETVSKINIKVKSKPTLEGRFNLEEAKSASHDLNSSVTITNRAVIKVEELGEKDSGEIPYKYEKAFLKKEAQKPGADGSVVWKLGINPAGQDMPADVSVIDTLPPELVYAKDSLSVSSDGDQVKKEDIIADYDEESNKVTFTVTKAFDVPVTISFKTTCKGGYNGGDTLKNQAYLYLFEQEIHDSADTTIPGGLVLSKDGSYDKNKKLITWKIGVNKQELTQENVSLTDILPKGLILTGSAKIDDVEVYNFDEETEETKEMVLKNFEGTGEDRAITLKKLINIGEDSNQHSEFTVDFGGNITKKHTIQIITKFEANTIPSPSYKNQVDMEANGKSQFLDASKEVTVNTKGDNLTKTVNYIPGEQILRWAINVNMGEWDRENILVADKFNHDGDVFQKNLRIKRIKIEMKEKGVDQSPKWGLILDTERSFLDLTGGGIYQSKNALELGYATGTGTPGKDDTKIPTTISLSTGADVGALLEAVKEIPQQLYFSFSETSQQIRITIDTEFKETGGDSINQHDGIAYHNRALVFYGNKLTEKYSAFWPKKNNPHKIDFVKTAALDGFDGVKWNISINKDGFPVDIEKNCSHNLTPGICITDQIPEGMELALTNGISYNQTTVPSTGINTGRVLVEGADYRVEEKEGLQTLILHLPMEGNRLKDAYSLSYVTRIKVREGMLVNTPVLYKNAVTWSYNDKKTISTESSQSISYFEAHAGSSGTVRKYGTATISKLKAENPTAQPDIFPGVEFSLYRIDGGTETFITKGITNSKGTISFGKLSLDQQYVIRESGGYDGYIPTEDIPVSFNSVGEFTKSVTNFKVTEDQPAQIVITKYKMDTQTSRKTVFNGVEFSLYQGETHIEDRKTDSSGRVVFENLLPNTAYTVKEISGYEGYVPSDPITITTGVTGSIMKQEIINYKSGVEPPVDPPINPPVDPPVNPPVDPPVNPPVDPPVNPPVDPPVDPPVNPPVNPPVDPPVNPPVNPPVDPPVTPPVIPPVEEVIPPEAQPNPVLPNRPGNGGNNDSDNDAGNGPDVLVTVDDEEVPLASAPAPASSLPVEKGITELSIINDEDVPLAALPKTGQQSRGLAYLAGLITSLGMLILMKKKKDESI